MFEHITKKAKLRKRDVFSLKRRLKGQVTAVFNFLMGGYRKEKANPFSKLPIR